MDKTCTVTVCTGTACQVLGGATLERAFARVEARLSEGAL